MSKLTHKMEALGLALAAESARLEEALPSAQDALRAIDLVDDLEARIQRAIGVRWTGAIPLHEPASDTFDPPPHPSRANIIAADGSQIYPNRHSVALYYLINIGSIVFQYGLDQPPICKSQPQVFFETNDMYDDDHIIASTEVDTRRDIAELAELASRASDAGDCARTLAMLDNGLLLHGAPHLGNHRRYDTALTAYLRELDLLRSSGSALAGIVDRPRAAQVLRLAHLTRLRPEEITPESVRSLGEFERLSDAVLFSYLAPGERSALFVSATPENLERYQTGGHKICFCYINVGHPGHPSVLRIEVPEWVAQDVDKLNLVHAGVVQQCRVTEGFPYVLIRAHELAIVTASERRNVDQMVTQAMLQRGLSPSISRKAQGKLWTDRHTGKW